MKNMKKIWKLAPIALLTLAAVPSFSATYAVIIGISDYNDLKDGQGNPVKDDKGNPVTLDLNGCANDAKWYSEILQNQYKVPAANIKMLTDGRATAENFVKALQATLQGIKPGDQLVFCYSGHGTQVESKTEADGKQEALVLADIQLVPGDFFKQLTDALGQHGIHSTFVFDCCFSGGMSRNPMMFDGKAIKTSKNRFVPATKATKKAMKDIAPKSLANLKNAALKGKGAQQNALTAFIFAGQEDQPTADLTFKDNSIEPHGLFTLVFASIVKDNPNAPLKDIVDATTQFLKDKGFAQVPGYEFSSPERGQMPSFLP